MIYLVRHGQTDWNTEHRIQGQRDVPLNGEGIAQAKARRPLFDGHHFDAVITSPLSRAQDTAKLLTEGADVGAFKTDPRLMEYDFGARTGFQRYVENPDGTLSERFKEAGPDEEDMDAFMKRIVDAVADAAAYPGDVLIVTHGAVLANLIRMFLGQKNTYRLRTVRSRRSRPSRRVKTPRCG